MKTFFVILYLVCIVVMGAVSMAASYINDSLLIFFVECITDLIAVTGIVLFLVKFRSRWWFVSFVSLIVGEIYLLTVDIHLAISDIFFIGIVFVPAIYLNYLVTQVQRHGDLSLEISSEGHP